MYLTAPDKTPITGNITSRILKEFPHEFVQPVGVTFNASVSSWMFPVIWKDSNISPIPKTSQPTCEGDIWPISLTAYLSKVLVAKWMNSDAGTKSTYSNLIAWNAPQQHIVYLIWYTTGCPSLILRGTTSVFVFWISSRHLTVLVIMSSSRSWLISE